MLEELGGIYNGVASQSYTGDYIIKNWRQQVYTLGTWSNPLESSPIGSDTPLDDKVYFAGETYSVDNPLYLRGSVQAAILSGYDSLKLLIFNSLKF